MQVSVRCASSEAVQSVVSIQSEQSQHPMASSRIHAITKAGGKESPDLKATELTRASVYLSEQ